MDRESQVGSKGTVADLAEQTSKINLHMQRNNGWANQHHKDVKKGVQAARPR